MKKILKNAFTVSELEQSIRNLHVTYIGSRKELNKIAYYFTIAAQTTSDSELSELIERAAYQANECIKGINTMRRSWEDTFLGLYEIEIAIEQILDYIKMQKNPDKYQHISDDLLVADKNFGIKAILDNMMAALIEALEPIIYLHSIFGNLYKSPYNSKEIEDIYRYLNSLIVAIQDEDSDSLSVQDVVNYIKVMRYIQDSLTIRASSLLR